MSNSMVLYLSSVERRTPSDIQPAPDILELGRLESKMSLSGPKRDHVRREMKSRRKRELEAHQKRVDTERKAAWSKYEYLFGQIRYHEKRIARILKYADWSRAETGTFDRKKGYRIFGSRSKRRKYLQFLVVKEPYGYRVHMRSDKALLIEDARKIHRPHRFFKRPHGTSHNALHDMEVFVGRLEAVQSLNDCQFPSTN